ncbi:hypothetical protein CYLTODRAFT_88046 [Cylindrobasidium torrendii FP15055 ss-10]|uniref:Zn(2)-C6 fungal-type domain-containing protein n=1 Tax=Cylindrobasidium torrendii FP15055 ss-10 TaxID=1314674 RepID=A0A0D7B2A8_9AGAR|nr:hypothetical protein CYLTODRAFT_88046 [Cylindrobasidium torrendii FP15055 ss-10]
MSDDFSGNSQASTSYVTPPDSTSACNTPPSRSLTRRVSAQTLQLAPVGSVPPGRRPWVCEPCRISKKRCDLGRPACQKCIRTKRAHLCVLPGDEASSIEEELKARVRYLEEAVRLRRVAARILHGDKAPIVEIPVPNLQPALLHIFLPHRVQVGICPTPQRLAAFQRQDTSSLHPALLHVAELWGQYNDDLEKEKRLDIMVVNESAAKRKTLLDRTISFCQDKRIDSTSLLQTYSILAVFLGSVGQGSRAREMLFAASTHIMQRDIHLLSLVESNSKKTVLTTEEELLSILASLLFVDQANFVCLRSPTLLPDYLYKELPMLSVCSQASSGVDGADGLQAIL